MEVGIIFDLDGVIVDTAKYHYLAWKKLAKKLGFDFTEKQNELFKGVSRKRCLEILLDIGKIKISEEEFEAYMVDKNKIYLDLIKKIDESEILPGVTTVLQFLKENKIPTALGSTSKNASFILKKIGLLHYFNAIIDGNKVTKAKPSPEIFLTAAKQLGVNAKNCVVFEDAVAGVEAANLAQMISIGIGNEEILFEANYSFKDFKHININFIKKLTKRLE